MIIIQYQQSNISRLQLCQAQDWIRRKSGLQKRLDLDYLTFESKLLNYESLETSDLSFWNLTSSFTIFHHILPGCEL